MSETGPLKNNLDPMMEKDVDGSRYVWFYFKSNNLPYDYQPVETFSKSEKFVPAEENAPQMGDVAWWGVMTKLVGIYDPHLPQPNPDTKYPLNLRTAFGERSYQLLVKEYGAVLWLRHVDAAPPQQIPGKSSWFKGLLKPKGGS